MTPRFPDKAAGKPYSVVMRSEGFSFMNVAVRGAVGGSDVYPSPQLGEQCVCCNADTDRRQDVMPGDPGGHFEPTEPLSVPICAECVEHAMAKTDTGIIAAMMCIVGLSLAYLGFVSYGHDVSGFVGVALAIGGALWLFVMRRNRLDGTNSGHHPGLELMVSPKQLVVRTYNRALAARVVALNEEHVKKVV